MPPPVTHTHLWPMIERIVRGGSRRFRHQSIRTLYLSLLCGTAALTILLTATLGGQVSMRALAATGAAVFELTVFAQIAAICLITPILFAGAIDQEASPRTWDLLRTTPLSSIGIVLGSLLGRLFFVLALIVAGLPILFIIRAFGGVSTTPVLQSAVIAICTATVVASAAVMLSATRSGGRRGVLIYFAGIGLVLTATWVGNTALVQGISGSMGARTTVFTPLNPFLVLDAVLHPTHPLVTTSYSSPLVAFWFGRPLEAFVAVSGVMTLGMLGWGILRVRILGPWMGQVAKTVSSNTRVARLIGRNPVAWRESAGRPRGRWDTLARWSWAAAALLGVVCVLSMIVGGQMELPTGRLMLRAALLVEIAVLTLATSTTAAASIARDRSDRTLDLLLTTPIQPKPYLEGKVIGIARLMSPFLLAPILTLMVVAVALLSSPTGSPLSPFTPESEPALSFASWGGLIGSLLCLIPFTAWCIAVGLSWSMRSQRVVQATLAATSFNLIAAGLFLPCLWSSSLNWFVAPLMMTCPATSIMMATSNGELLDGWPWTGPLQEWTLIGSGLIGGLIWTTLATMLLQTTTRAFTPTMRRLYGVN